MSDIITLNNGIDVYKYSNDEKHYNYDKPVKCLMLYHHLEKKGIKEGIQAFEIARKKYPSLSLTMFGLKDPVDLPSYIRYIKNPSIEELKLLYNQSDIFIFPSLYEGWGLTVIEAMCAKCAVVGTRTGCLIDIGVDNQNVLLSNPGDTAKMADNIFRLVKDRSLLTTISEGGFESVKSMNWDNTADRLNDIVSNSIGEGE